MALPVCLQGVHNLLHYIVMADDDEAFHALRLILHETLFQDMLVFTDKVWCGSHKLVHMPASGSTV